MDVKLANDLIYVFGYAAVGLAFAFGPLLAVYLLAPRTLRQTVGKSGQESTLLKMTLKYSVGLLLFVCIWTFILTLML